MDNKPRGYYGNDEEASMRSDSEKEKEVFPDLTDEQVDLRESERTQHQENVDAIQRRGLHDRVVSKLAHWQTLKDAGYPLSRGDEAEVVLLSTMFDEVVEAMKAAGQTI